jgi:hypothetical protein
MNLKEAFRYQNKLQHLMDEAAGILYNDRNVVRVEKTALLHKVNPEAQDEVTVEEAPSEYAEQINDIAALLLFLLSEREKLSRAIREAKNSMDLDFDSEVSMNARRQELAGMFRTMAEIRSSEQILPGQGQGFKFNAEGNQVSYRCDLKKVTTINFDRNKIRSYASGLSKKADRISAELDRCLVITEVSYGPPFDVNDSFAGILAQPELFA